MDNISRTANGNFMQPDTIFKSEFSRELEKIPEDVVTITGAQAREKGAIESLGDWPSPTTEAQIDKVAAPQVVYADCYGQITHLAIQVDGDVTRNPNIGREVFNTIKTLFKEMEPDTKFTIIFEQNSDMEKVKQIMKEIEMPDPDRVNLLLAPYNITSWMRDNVVMAYIPGDKEHSRMIDKVPFHSHDHPGLPKFIADHTPDLIYMKEPKLRTDGGDVVSNSQEAFVGYDSIYLTAMNLFRQFSLFGLNSFNSELLNGTPPVYESPYFSKRVVFHNVPSKSHLPKYHLEKNPNYIPYRTDGINHERASLQKSIEYFEKIFNKKIVVIGDDDPNTRAQEGPATFHIDMGVTPVDDQTVFVGSPIMAMDIIKKWPKEKYKAANDALRGETGLNGDILGDLIRHNSEPDPTDCSVMKIPNNFEAEVRKLQALGKNVVRIPYLEGNSRKGTPWMSYGNCLMQNFTTKDGRHVKNVFLPVFGTPLDDVAKEAYEKQGFKVIPLPLAAFTGLAGAIRCMSNYFGRSPAV